VKSDAGSNVLDGLDDSEMCQIAWICVGLSMDMTTSGTHQGFPSGMCDM